MDEVPAEESPEKSTHNGGHPDVTLVLPDATGRGKTDTFAVAVDTHRFASVPITVKVIGEVGETEIEFEVMPLLHK